MTAGLANARAYEEERRRAEALAELDRAKTAFFSNVSHEFRTPLTLMLGPTEDALRCRRDRALRGEDLEHASIATKLRLLKLVNTLLDFSRIEAGRVQAHVRARRPRAADRGPGQHLPLGGRARRPQLRVDGPPLPEPIYVDREMWEKIVLNLLSNAFKFTFDGEIGVTLRLDGRPRRAARVRHRRRHPGARAARACSSASTASKARGPARTKAPASASPWSTIWCSCTAARSTVESEPGRGTTFTVSLPTGSAHLPAERVGAAESPGATAAARGAVCRGSAALAAADCVSAAASPQPAAAAAVEPARPRARILVADDNADMRDYVARLLRPYWDVETVSDGQHALEAIRAPAARPAPHRRHDADARRLRPVAARSARDPAIAHLPVIMLSARAGDEARVEGIEAGADDYLVKPFSARELVARVATHFGLGRTRKRLEEHAAELESARDRLEQATRAKDEFLAMLGHELRNPLAPILTALQLMQLKGAPEIEKERTDHRAPGQAPRAPGRRPARRLAHHARQDRAEERARARCRASSRGRSSWQARCSKRAASGSMSTCRRPACASTPIRRGSPR